MSSHWAFWAAIATEMARLLSVCQALESVLPFRWLLTKSTMLIFCHLVINLSEYQINIANIARAWRASFFRFMGIVAGFAHINLYWNKFWWRVPGLENVMKLESLSPHFYAPWANLLIWYSRYILAETFGNESESILQTAELWKRNISGFIGPQETCAHEARLAGSFNLPMISHFCTNAVTSDKVILIYNSRLLWLFSWALCRLFILPLPELDHQPVWSVNLWLLSCFILAGETLHS